MPNTSSTHTAFLGLGSNMGDRLAMMRAAVAALAVRPGVTVGGVSSLYETEPVGGSDGVESYLNAVVRVDTNRTPRELLEILLDIERSLGRVRRERWGPRLIDIDLLLYEGTVSSDTALTVPHPRLHERRFVLEPLAEIAPQVVHPVLDATVADLARRGRAELSGQAVTLVAGPEWAEAVRV